MTQEIAGEAHSEKNWAQINRDLYLHTNDTVHQRWERHGTKGFDYFINEQMTIEGKEALEKAGLPTFTVNEITPVIEMMRYFATANDPRWKGVGTEGSDIDIAHIHTIVAEHSWKLSKGRSVYAQNILDSLTRGLGIMQVYVDPDSDRGQGDVLFKCRNPKHIYVDKQSTDIMWDDAGFVLLKLDLPKMTLKNQLPKYASIIDKANGDQTYNYSSLADRLDSQAVIDEDVRGDIVNTFAKEEDIIDYYECYRKVKVPYVSVFLRIMPTGEELKRIQETVNVKMAEFIQEATVQKNEQIGKLREALNKPPADGGIIQSRFDLEVSKLNQMLAQKQATIKQDMTSQMVKSVTKLKQYIVAKSEWEKEKLKPQVINSLVDSVEFNQTRITVTVTAGDKFLYKKPIKNLEYYPLIPFPYTFTGTPMPMGAVQPLIGKQDEINKAHQIMIHNANLGSSLRWKYFEGSIDVDEWEQYSSSAGALLKVRQGMEMPEEIQPAQLNNAFYEIVRQGKEEIQYQSGIPSFLQGQAGGSGDTYRGMLANDEYGTRRIKSWMHNIVEPALERVGEVHKQLAQATYKANKVFRIVQPNAGGGYDEKITERTAEINIPKYNSFGKQIGLYHDYASARFDVKIVAGSTLPVNRWALVDEFFKWFQAGAVDDIAFIEQADIPNKERLIERMSRMSQMGKQIEGLERDNDDLKGLIERLKSQIIQGDIKHTSSREQQRIENASTQTKSQIKVQQKDLQNEIKMQKRELSLMVKTVFEEFKLALKKELQAQTKTSETK